MPGGYGGDFFDIEDPDQFQRLRNAVDWSRRRLRPFRENRFGFVNQYVGFHFSENAVRDRVPVNLMEMAVSIFTRQLAAQNPAVMVTTKFRELKAMASTLELALNHQLNEMWFSETLRCLVVDSLFSVGIAKVGLNRFADVEVMGFKHDVGQVFIDCVDLDDWVVDMTARRWDQIQYAGNKYRLPLDYVKDSPQFANTDHLGPLRKTNYNEEGDQKVETISRGIEGDQDEYQDMVELWDLWLPMENMFVTFAADDDGGPVDKPLRVVTWDGPEAGPYHLLSFNIVPNSIMPLPPAALWMDLHELENAVFRKLGRQGERQKTILGVQSGAQEDGERIVDASDGEAIRVDNPDKAREYKFGGVDQASLAFSVHVKDLFTYLAGNLDALGGLGPQSETLGQDQLLVSNASKRVADMQDRVTGFVTRLVNDVAWYLWTDPLVELPLIKRIPGVDLDIPVSFTPEQREGDFLDFNIQIVPYSSAHQTPQTKLRTMVQLFQTIIIPLGDRLQAQGIVPNWEAFLRNVAEWTNMPELDEVLMFFESDVGQQPQPVLPSKPATTMRINERRSVPGTTIQGRDNQLMQALLSNSNAGSNSGATNVRAAG